MNSNPTLTSTRENLPHHFSYRFLEQQGAVLEKKQDGYEALLSENMAALLNVPDFITVKKEDRTHPGKSNHIENEDHAEISRIHPIAYGSPLLDKMTEIASREVPLVSCQLHFDYIKTQGFKRLLDDRFSFLNAVVNVESQGTVNTVYILLNAHYQARSDEQKDGLVTLMFNQETGALIPSMQMMLIGLDREFLSQDTTGLINQEHLHALLPKIQKNLTDIVASEIRDFRESMNRRFYRDVRHMQEYYDGLKQEMEESLKRPGLSAQLIHERWDKIGLIPQELARKTDDLFKKYSIKISVRPCAVMHIKTPAVKLLLKAMIGKAIKNISIIYNPVTKDIDPLICQGCGRETHKIKFCGRLHLNCPHCWDSCPKCS